MIVMLAAGVFSAGFAPSLHATAIFRNPRRESTAAIVMDQLREAPPINTTQEAAFRFQQTVTDLDEGLYGLDTRDAAYGVEIVRQKVSLPLGLQLTEELVFGIGGDVRSLALVEAAVLGGGAAAADFRAGDALTYLVVEAADGKVERVERVEGLGLDDTMDAVRRIAEGATELTITTKRLVGRRVVGVTVLQPDGKTVASRFDCLAGSNLRGELLRREIRIYDETTKRFDNPFGTGDCAGEGLCGTCLVEMRQGVEACSPRNSEEELLLSTRPARWRLACRLYVGKDNEPGGEVTVRLRPQSVDAADTF